MSENRSYLGRMIDVLDLVVHAESPLTATRVAALADMPVSTAFRLTGFLVERGLLERQASGELVPGSHLLALGLRALARFGATQELDAITRRLAGTVPESISAGLLVGEEIVLVARHEPTHSLRVVARVGDVIPPHTSAMGKSIMAFLSPRRRIALVSRSIGPDRAEQVCADLAQELEEVRATGFARDEETYAIGQRCRAVPLTNPHTGVYGGLSIAGPTPRFSAQDADESVPALLDASRSLGTVRPLEEATA